MRGEFLASTDERFRPVNLSLAPDGTLYVVDMYRGIIQHKGYMTEYLRDYVLKHKLEQPNSFGRIYRIVHETTGATRRRCRRVPRRRSSSACCRIRTAGGATWRSSCSSSAATSRSCRRCESSRRAAATSARA